MLSIADELKIIQQSTTEEERRRRAQQLQQRLQEDALRRKLRNVRLIGSVERLAERASSLRQLTDRLRLIKRQYEVLATHLPDDDPSSQSQLFEPAAALRHSQSATSVGETEHHRQTALKAASGDPTAGLSHLVEGYYDPRLAARGWQGAADPWGPSSQQLLGRDELGRSTESRAALLRSRIATSVTVRSEPPAPPGDRGVNYAAVGEQTWERGGEMERDRDARGPGPGHRDPSDWERSEWDRSGPGERSSAPMQDRSVSEYSVSAPGRRRVAPPAWDGTLDGVASRWGTLERPTAADEQLQQLDSALARQRQLLAATAAATERAETAAAKSSEEAHHAPLPRLRTGSWLNPEPSTSDQRHWESGPDPRTSDGGSQYRGQEHYTGNHGPYVGDQGTHQMHRETNVRFADSSYNENHYNSQHENRSNYGKRPGHGDRSSFAGHSDYLEPPDAEPRCPAHQAMHEAGQTRRYEEDGARFERDPSGGGEGERMREIAEDDERAEMEAEEREMRRQESFRRREEEEEERRRWEEKRRAEEERMREEERRREEEERRREDEMRRAEEERRREEEERRQEERRKEDQRRQEEEQRRREEADRKREEEVRAAAERQTAARKASVTSNASSHGMAWNGRSAALDASPTQGGANNGKQNAKKKKNMDWLLGGGHSSGESDGEQPGGGRGKPTGDAASGTKYSGAPSTADRPSAASRQSSHGSTAAAPIPATRRTVDTSSSDEAVPARTPAPAAAPAPAKLAPAAAEKPMKIRLDSGSDSYHLSADLGGDESDDDFWG